MVDLMWDIRKERNKTQPIRPWHAIFHFPQQGRQRQKYFAPSILECWRCFCSVFRTFGGCINRNYLTKKQARKILASLHGFIRLLILEYSTYIASTASSVLLHLLGCACWHSRFWGWEASPSHYVYFRSFPFDYPLFIYVENQLDNRSARLTGFKLLQAAPANQRSHPNIE